MSAGGIVQRARGWTREGKGRDDVNLGKRDGAGRTREYEEEIGVQAG